MTNDLYRNCELEVLFYHSLALIPLLIFCARWIPMKKFSRFAHELKRNPLIAILDAINATTFLLLIMASALLIILPVGHLSTLSQEMQPVRTYGKVERISPKGYIWPVDYDNEKGNGYGVYLHVNSQKFFSPTSAGICNGDIVYVSYLPDSSYILSIDIETASSLGESLVEMPWCFIFARYVLLLTGSYLAVRLFILLGQEAERKREELVRQRFPLFEDTPPQKSFLRRKR